MPSIEQYKAALIEAHKNGDEQAAQLFATRISDMQGVGEMPAPPPGAVIHNDTTFIETPEQERNFAVEQEAGKKADKLGGLQAFAPLLQGLGFEGGDEVVGAAGGLVEAAKGGSFRDAYDINRRAVEISNEREFQSNPGRAFASQLGGAIASGLAAPAVAPFKGGALASAGNAAATGSALGAVAGGLGASPDSRIEGAAIGAGIGGALGPVAQGIAPAARMLFRPLTAQIAPKASAQSFMNALLRRSGKSAKEISDEMSLAAQEGQGGEFVLADALGNPGQRALSTIARTPSDARAGVIEELERRQAGQSSRVANQLSEAFDAPDTADARRLGLIDARRAQAAINPSLRASAVSGASNASDS